MRSIARCFHTAGQRPRHSDLAHAALSGRRPAAVRLSGAESRGLASSSPSRCASSPSRLSCRISETERLETMDDGLTIRSEAVPGHGASSHSVSWIRLLDGCPCPNCIHPSTRQKIRTSADAVRELGPSVQPDVRLWQDPHINGEGLLIKWPSHESFYSWDVLRQTTRSSRPSSCLTTEFRRILWDEATLLDRSERLRFHFDQIQSAHRVKPDHLLRILKQLQVFGLVVIEGVPNNATSDAECYLRRVAGWVGEIRDTFYGQTWNVKNMRNSKNVAYTNLNLGLHMDLLYFSSPPRFQLLHCLRNQVEGGSSYFVDSFKAAHDLAHRNQASHEILSNAALDYEYDNDGHYLHYRHKVIDGDPNKLHSAVNWSPPFQGRLGPQAFVFGDRTIKEVELYQALADFEDELARPDLCHEFLLKEGDLVMFDNRRVLHARRAFRERSSEAAAIVAEGEPSRWLKGLYLDGEAVWDRLVTLHEQHAET